MVTIFTIKDVIEIVKARQDDKYDANIAISGARGDGKSTLGCKICYKYGGYDPWKHQVYSRKDARKLLVTQQRGLIFDDEAINSTYKRAFYDKEQQNLIRDINMYRSNENLYLQAIPSFFFNG